MSHFEDSLTGFDPNELSRLVEIDSCLPRIVTQENTQYAPFPLTEIQRAYYLGRDPSLPLGGIACQFYFELSCDDLDDSAYCAAWRTVFARHPMLRARLLDGATQVVPRELPTLHIPIHDWRALPDQNGRLDALRTRLARGTPPGDQTALINVELSRLTDDRTHIHLRFDLLVTDQHSILTLLDEVAFFYNDPKGVLPRPGLSFRDYVTQFDDETATKRALAYWRKRAKSMPPSPQLPYISPLESVSPPKIERLARNLEAGKWDALKHQAAEIGVTPSCLLLGLFAEALSEWTRAPHFSLNLTLFNRAAVHPDIDAVVGDFTNNLLLEVDLRGKRSREETFRHLQKQLWQDMEHASISGMTVAREMALAQGHLDCPIMPVVFTSTLSQTDSAMISNTAAHPGRPVMTLSQTPQVVLDCQLTQWDGVLAINWDVAVNALDISVLTALFERYFSLIEAQAETPSLKDRIIGKPSDPCADMLVGGSPFGREASTRRLTDLWLETIPTAAHRPAIGLNGRCVSHHDLAKKVSGLCSALKARGIGPNRVVCIALPKSEEQIIACLATSVVGATYVPLDTAQPEARQERILADLRPDIVLYGNTEPLVLATASPDLESLNVHGIGEADPADLSLYEGAKSQDLAYIIYTSGTTGVPKGVMITHEAALVTIDDIRARFEIDETARVLSLSQLHFDLSVFDIFGVLGGGGCLVLPDQEEQQNPAHWEALCRDHSVTLWNTVPSLFAVHLDYLETDAHTPAYGLDTIMMSGDWVPLDVPERARRYWPKAHIYSLGGATEAAIWSIFHKIDDVDPNWSSIPYGKALSAQQIFVLDDSLALCPPGQEGELFIAGPGLAEGYFGDLEKTAHHFFEHPRTGLRLYRTGDLGNYLADGTIIFCGRADSQVKINGYRVETKEISRILKNHSQVEEAIVLPVGEKRHPRLAAFVRYRESERVMADNGKELAEFLKTQLPDYMVPLYWHGIPRWPLTPNGKVDHKALGKMVDISSQITTQADHHRHPVLPAEKVQQEALGEAVLKMVADVVGVDRVSMDDNLVHLGATSLELIALASRIEKFCQKRPPLGELARAVRMTDLVELVRKLQPEISTSLPQGLEVVPGETQLRRYLEKNRTITDPTERRLFKNALLGAKFEGETIPLNGWDAASLHPSELERRSVRTYGERPVHVDELAALLQALCPYYVQNTQKRRYASAGGLYPVEARIVVPKNGIEGLKPGAYRYHPQGHRLSCCGSADAFSDFGTLSSGNRDWMATARFLIVFVASLEAIAPLYDSSSLSFALIECGAMSQLLEHRASALPLGLCQIGDLPLGPLSEALGLGPTHVALHGLVGGGLDETDRRVWRETPKTYDLELSEGTL